MATTSDLTLNRGAIRILQQILASLGWYTETQDAYRAGVLLESPEFQLPVEPEVDGKDAAQAWMSEAVVLPVTAGQREALKHCVEHYLKKGGLPPGRFTNAIIRELQLASED